jgi:hypothetical protein
VAIICICLSIGATRSAPRSANGTDNSHVQTDANPSAREQDMSQTQPVVRLLLKLSDTSAHVEYEIRNALDQPIYVFDRLYDMRSEKLSDDWAYRSVDRSTAVIARQVWPLPRGLRHENPETPYGRLVAPHAIVTGQFSVPLPLTEHDPYYLIVHERAKPVQVSIDSLVFRVGWAPASKLRAGSDVQLGGETLTLFPFPEALAKQQLTDSNSAAVNLSATVMQ